MKLSDLAALNAARAAREPVALVSDLERGSIRVVTMPTLRDDPLAETIAECMRADRGAGISRDGREYFVAVHMPPVRLLLIGAVHISQALAPMASAVGLDVIVLDPRTAFASPERFPSVRLVAQWPEEVLPALALDAYTAVALLTHDPRIDDQALVAALRAKCFYIGALGSRKTQTRRRERMAEAGFAASDLAAIHGPIGLDIGASSPAEIAVAILAQIVSVMRRRTTAAAEDAAA